MSKKLGTHIRTLRRDRNMSQADLGSPQFSASYISLIESGQRTATPEVLEHIAQALGTTTAELTRGSEPAVEQQTVLDLRWAELSLLNGEPRAAEIVLRRITSSSENVPRGTRRRAMWALSQAQERLSDYRAASETLLALSQETYVADTDPTATDLVIARTRCYRDAGDIAMALDLGESVLSDLRERGTALTADEVSVMSAVAACYEERGDLMRAMEITEAAVAATQGNGDDVAAGRALWAASNAAQASGRTGDALRLADRAIARFGEALDEGRLASLQANQAWLQLKLPEPDLKAIEASLEHAIEALQRVSSPSDVGTAQTELARCLLMQGRFDQAAEVAASASANTQGSERASALLIEVSAAMTLPADHHRALALLELADEALGAAPASRLTASIWREVAGLRQQLNDSAGAIEAYEHMADACGLPSPHHLELRERANLA